MPPKLKKTLKWTAIGLGGVVVVVGSILGLMWAGTGASYQGSMMELVPARHALAVITIDQPAVRLDQVANRLDDLFGSRQGVKVLEQSPLWRDAVGAEDGDAELALSGLGSKVRTLLQILQTQLASAPGGLELGTDLLMEEAVAAVFRSSASAKPEVLFLTRCSPAVEFGWKFRGFGSGTYGTTVVEKKGDNLQVTTADEILFIGQRLDTLVVSSNESLIADSLGLIDGAGSRFYDLPQIQRAREASAKESASIRAYVNLDQVRAIQEKDEAGLAALDRIFTLPSEVLQLSPEIMPTIRTVFERSIDTRVFDGAAWAVQLEDDHSAVLHQFLTGDEARLKQEFAQLVPAWSLPPAERTFLDILPGGTWFVATMRQPFKEIRASAKPNLDEQGKPKESAVYSFLQALGDDPRIDSIGLAFLDQRYALDPEADRDKMPPGVVSSVAFPPFAMFMHWPGVTTRDALSLMQEQLRLLGAQKVSVGLARAGDNEYVTFKLLESSDLVNWLTQFSSFAVNDYLVFSFSRQNSAVAAIFDAAQTEANSLAGQPNAPFAAFENRYSAFVSLSSQGFGQFSERANLPNALGAAVYSSTNPYGKSLADWRREKAEELKLDIRDERLDDELDKLRREWVGERAPFETRVRQNIRGLGAVRDFTAQTTISGAVMHTHFLIRMAE